MVSRIMQNSNHLSELSNTSIGQRVKQQRAKLELSQAQLAELSGVSLPTIKNIELDKRAVPRGETIRKLSKALQVSTQYLRNGE